MSWCGLRSVPSTEPVVCCADIPVHHMVQVSGAYQAAASSHACGNLHAVETPDATAACAMQHGGHRSLVLAKHQAQLRRPCPQRFVRLVQTHPLTTTNCVKDICCWSSPPAVHTWCCLVPVHAPGFQRWRHKQQPFCGPPLGADASCFICPQQSVLRRHPQGLPGLCRHGRKHNPTCGTAQRNCSWRRSLFGRFNCGSMRIVLRSASGSWSPGCTETAPGLQAFLSRPGMPSSEWMAADPSMSLLPFDPSVPALVAANSTAQTTCNRPCSNNYATSEWCAIGRSSVHLDLCAWRCIPPLRWLGRAKAANFSACTTNCVHNKLTRLLPACGCSCDGIFIPDIQVQPRGQPM